MKSFIYNNVRVQFLSQEIVRLELGKKGEFCDSDTFLIPNKNSYNGADFVETQKSDGIELSIDSITVTIPKNCVKLNGIKIFADGVQVYAYKKIKNSGELPELGKTPYAFPIMDNPRIIVPDGGYCSSSGEYCVDEKAEDVYVLLCKRDAKLLRRLYVELTGKAELVRLSTLGSWNSRYYKYSQRQAEQMISDYKNHDVPLDNIVLDTDWRAASDRGIGYDVDTKLFPDMKGYFEFAHKHDVEVMFNDHPEPLDGASNLTDKKEIAFREYNLSRHLKDGLDYWWYDRNWSTILKSPTRDIAPETWGMYLFSDVTKRVWQSKAKDKQVYRRPIVMSNVDNVANGNYMGIGNSASHRYPFQWTGDIGSDYTHLFTAVQNTLKCGVNAIPYVHPDCGGHVGNPDKELFVRWMQYGSLCPVLRPHCTNYVERFREPWNYDGETLSIVRNYIKMRYRLLPVIYKEAYESYEYGSPICKPMAWNYPDDKRAANLQTQYTIGSNVLVAPVTGGAIYDVPRNDYLFGVSACYYNGTELNGEPILRKEYSQLSVYLNHTSPEKEVPVYNFSAVFNAKLCPKDDVDLLVEADDGVRVWIDGVQTVDDWSTHSAMTFNAGSLQAGRIYDVKIEYFQGGGAACIALHYVKRKDAERQSVYLPQGQWLDVFTGKIYDGGKSVKLQRTLTQMPLFARLGGSLFLAKNALSTKKQKWDRLIWDVYPSKQFGDKGYLYEDDRNTTAYKLGKFRKTRYEQYFDADDNCVVLRLDASCGDFDGIYCCKQRTLKLKYHLLRDCANVNEVTVNGRKIDFAVKGKKRKEFPFSDGGYAPDGKVLTAEVQTDVGSSYEIRFYLAKDSGAL